MKHKAKKSLGPKHKFARAKKALGQNFLKSELALRKIVEAGEIQNEDIILEIGPGKGALTEKLLEKSKHVIAVEKDRELFEFLKNKFGKEIKNKKLNLVEGDCLNFNPKDYNLEARTYKLISNIPYNITGAILKKFLTAEVQPTRMVLMVQHEVARRIIAHDEKESLLSISVKAYGEPKMIMKVPARYFSPSPKVDSAVISIQNISRKVFTLPPLPLAPPPLKGGGKNEVQGRTLNSLEFEERFWKVLKAGFAHKRKKLSGNLKGVCQGSTLTLYADKRAEDLRLSDWIALLEM